MANQATSFMSLPAELRNEIYEMAFTDHIVAITAADDWERIESPLGIRYYKRPYSTAPGILLANKQIHHEAITYYYRHSLFTFGPYPWPLRWSQASLGDVMQAAIDWLGFLKPEKHGDFSILRILLWMEGAEYEMSENDIAKEWFRRWNYTPGLEAVILDPPVTFVVRNASDEEGMLF